MTPTTLDELFYRRRAGYRPEGLVLYVVAHGEEPPPTLPWLLYRPDMAASPYLVALAGLRVRIVAKYRDLTIRKFRIAALKLGARVSLSTEDLDER